MEGYVKATKTINFNGINFNIVIKNVKNPRIELGEDFKIIINNENNLSSFINNNYEWLYKKSNFIKSCIKKSNNILNNNLIIMNDNFSYGNVDYIDFENKIINKDINYIIFKKIIINKLNKKIIDKLDYYKNKYNFNYNKITIRNEKTKWGNCSSDNNLNFNIKIAFIPENLFNYIIFHEIIHSKIKKHNKIFYNYISKEFNDYKKLDEELYIYWYYSDMVIKLFDKK